MRIDQCDVPAESATCKGARAHIDGLPEGNSIQIALGDIDQNPNHLMVDNTEQHVARPGAHPIHRGALDDFSVLRREPRNRSRDFTRALDLGDNLFGNGKIFQPPARPFQSLASQRAV